MKDKIHNPQPLIFTRGYISDQYYNSYEKFTQSMYNYNQQCPYQLDSNGFSGHHQVLQLSTMQISHAKRKGSTMHTATTAKDCLIISLVGADTDKSCFGHRKMNIGDILFFDDSHSNILMANGAVEFTAIAIDKSLLGSQLSLFSKLIDHHIKDTNEKFSTILQETWKHFSNPSAKKDQQSLKEAESKIWAVLIDLLSDQTPVRYKLTAGEKTVFTICDQVFHHMDGKIDIGSLAKQHQCTKQTLTVNFKSLFGFTPQYFLRLLKLNHVHYELSQSSPDESTVTEIALKWGFMHMGRFSAYYTELFGQNPSVTLKNSFYGEQGTEESCVARQEEMS